MTQGDDAGCVAARGTGIGPPGDLAGEFKGGAGECWGYRDTRARGRFL